MEARTHLYRRNRRTPFELLQPTGQVYREANTPRAAIIIFPLARVNVLQSLTL